MAYSNQYQTPRRPPYQTVSGVETSDTVATTPPWVPRSVDELWVEIPEKHAKILEQELAEELSADERETLSMYLDRLRSRDPFWGK